MILIGAGSGIGPLAGFISANRRRRPMYLLFGARHPASDYLYREDIDSWLSDGRLTGVATAFSRVQSRTYVQDRLRQEAQTLRGLIADGAQILVCGGRGGRPGRYPGANRPDPRPVESRWEVCRRCLLTLASRP